MDTVDNGRASVSNLIRVIADQSNHLRQQARECVARAKVYDSLLREVCREGKWVNVRTVELKEGKPYFIRRPGCNKVELAGSTGRAGGIGLGKKTAEKKKADYNKAETKVTEALF